LDTSQDLGSKPIAQGQTIWVMAQRAKEMGDNWQTPAAQGGWLWGGEKVAQMLGYFDIRSVEPGVGTGLVRL